MISISEKQEQMLAFIENFVEKNGYPPTYEEIRTGLDISTKSLVDYHLGVLENADFIQRIPNTPRGLRLTTELQPEPSREVQSLAGKTNGSSPDLTNLDDRDIIELTYNVVTNNNNLYALKVANREAADNFAGNGDIVIIQRQNYAENGELVAIKLAQGDTKLKRYYRENGHVRLQSANSSENPEVIAPDALEIEGKVVAVIRQLDQTQA